VLKHTCNKDDLLHSFEDDNLPRELEDSFITQTHSLSDPFNTFYTIDRSDGHFLQPGALMDDDSDELCLFRSRKHPGLQKTKGAGIYAFGGFKWIHIKPMSAATNPCS
jgi:hypothetical protein